MWSKYKRSLADGTDASSHLKRAHITSEAMLQVQRMAKQKRIVSNFYLNIKHFVRGANVHFVTCSRESENIQENFHKAGWFCQLCEVTYSMLLPGDSSGAETSTASGLKPLHYGLLWTLHKI